MNKDIVLKRKSLLKDNRPKKTKVGKESGTMQRRRQSCASGAIAPLDFEKIAQLRGNCTTLFKNS